MAAQPRPISLWQTRRGSHRCHCQHDRADCVGQAGTSRGLSSSGRGLNQSGVRSQQHSAANARAEMGDDSQPKPPLGYPEALSVVTSWWSGWDPARGLFQGQRSRAARQQAGHMTAPDRRTHQTGRDRQRRQGKRENQETGVQPMPLATPITSGIINHANETEPPSFNPP